MDALDPDLTSESDMRDEIARLETRIEALTDSIERCRKISIAAQFILAAGTMWVVLIVFRIVPFASIHVVGAISALLGGTVLFGSNASTWKQTLSAIAETEARRAALIDAMALRTVEEPAESRTQ